MSCNCSAQGAQPCRCGFLKNKTAPSRAYIDKCVDCDPCDPCESMVKICSFVAANMEDVVTRRNSFVYNQEDDAVYYVDDSGNPLRFGASPMFIDNFDPESVNIKRQIVIDTANKKLYTYAPDGTYILFDLDVQEEVSKKIDEMIEDGSLGEILAEYVYPKLDNGFYNKSNSITLNRISRELIPREGNPDYTDSTYPNPQGGCYIGNDILVQASVRDGSNNTLIRVINVKTGVTQRSAVLPLQHANSITFNPTKNELYVTSLVSGSTNTHYVYVVDYTTLTIIKTIDLSDSLAEAEGTHSIAYDKITGKTILCTEVRGANNLAFYNIDIEEETIESIDIENYHNLLVNSTLHKWATNDIEVNDNILYVLKHSPNVIAMFDLTTGKIINVYNINNYMRYGSVVGEVENISIDKDTLDMYIVSTYIDCEESWFRVLSINRYNLAHGEESADSYLSNTGEATVYVDENSTATDPTGSSAKPFKTIGEALERLNDGRIKSLTVYLREGTYPYVNIKSDKIINIRPTETTQQANYVVRGIEATASNLVITGITISGTGDYDLTLRQSKARITACRFTSENEHMYAGGSTVSIFNLKDEDNNFIKIHCASESVIDVHDNKAEYKFTNQLPSLTKPVLIAKGWSAVKNTNVDISYAGNELAVESENNMLYLWLSSQAGFVKVPFVGSSTTKSHYLSCVSGGNMVRLVVAINVDNKTIGLRTQTVIQLTNTTPSDAISTVGFNGSVYLEGTI